LSYRFGKHRQAILNPELVDFTVLQLSAEPDEFEPRRVQRSADVRFLTL
jgi:hypothetical protein